MSDEIDEAQERSQLFLDQALNWHFRRSGAEKDFRFLEDDNLRTCVDCEDLIDADRLEANPHAIRCLDCQQNHERRARLGLI